MTFLTINNTVLSALFSTLALFNRDGFKMYWWIGEIDPIFVESTTPIRYN